MCVYPWMVYHILTGLPKFCTKNMLTLEVLSFNHYSTNRSFTWFEFIYRYTHLDYIWYLLDITNNGIWRSSTVMDYMLVCVEQIYILDCTVSECCGALWIIRITCHAWSPPNTTAISGLVLSVFWASIGVGIFHVNSRHHCVISGINMENFNTWPFYPDIQRRFNY